MNTRKKKIDFVSLASGRATHNETFISSGEVGGACSVDSSAGSVLQDLGLSTHVASMAEVEDRNLLDQTVIEQNKHDNDLEKVSSDNEPSDNSDSATLDAELAELMKQQQKIKAKLQSKEKKNKVEQLKAENKRLMGELKASTTCTRSGSVSVGATLTSAPSGSAAASGCAQPGQSRPSATCTLPQLRQIEGLAGAAEQKMRTQGVLVSSSSDSGAEGRGRSKIRSKKIRSGKTAKPAHSVKQELAWPHSQLTYGYEVEHADLDFPLLVAGELACIQSVTIGEEEKQGRLDLLLALAYHVKCYEWKACLNFHAACLLEIERGARAWSHSQGWLRIEANTLYRYPLREDGYKFGSSGKQSQGALSAPKRWFCAPYQRGECNHKGSHDAMIRGAHRTAEHFCAACLQKSNVFEFHAETSKDCPLNNDV